MNDELINKLNEYEVWNIDKYVNYILNLGIDNNIEGIKESFNKFSKGFRFIIAVFRKGKGYDFYSVPYFNDKVIGNS